MLSFLLLILYGSHCSCCDSNFCNDLEENFPRNCNDPDVDEKWWMNWGGSNNQLIATPPISGTTQTTQNIPFYTIRVFEKEDPTVPLQYGKLVIRNVSKV